MKEETINQLREIKSRFRFLMNGVASQSMREMGLGYKLNWGIGLPLLKDMASEYGKNMELAIELWKEDIRECKLMALLIMPAEEMDAALVDLWVSQIPNVEIAEMAAFYLFQYLPTARDYAFKWISSAEELTQICGYSVLSRLFLRGVMLDTRELNEYIDQAQTALSGESITLKRDVIASISKLASCGEDYENILRTAFKAYNLNVF